MLVLGIVRQIPLKVGKVDLFKDHIKNLVLFLDEYHQVRVSYHLLPALLKSALQFAFQVDLGNEVCERELTKAIQ